MQSTLQYKAMPVKRGQRCGRCHPDHPFERNPMARWVLSQKGRCAERPQRHRATRVARRISLPCSSFTSTSPRRRSGPFRTGTTVSCSSAPSWAPPSSRTYSSAPVGQRLTAAATASASPAARFTQGRFLGLNAAGSARMHAALWMHRPAYQDTRIRSFSYTRVRSAGATFRALSSGGALTAASSRTSLALTAQGGTRVRCAPRAAICRSTPAEDRPSRSGSPDP